MERGERTRAWLQGGDDPDSYSSDPYDETAEALLAMGRLATSRLVPIRIHEFRRLIEADMRSQRFGDHQVFREWLRRSELGPHALAEAFLDETERGRYMRAMAPLRAFISKEERSEILRSVAFGHGLGTRSARDKKRNAE